MKVVVRSSHRLMTSLTSQIGNLFGCFTVGRVFFEMRNKEKFRILEKHLFDSHQTEELLQNRNYRGAVRL